MKKSYNPKTVVVLGSQRSGTSVVSGILSTLGVDMGNFRQADETNPYGYFEDLEFSKLIKEIFDLSGGDGYNPPSHEKIKEEGERIRDKIKGLCLKKSNNREVWGWKVPGTNLTIDLFLPYLDKPYFVVVFRDPLEVASSITKRADLRGDKEISYFKALRLVSYYNKEILDFLERHPDLPRLFVSFEKLLKNPTGESKRLANFLDIELTKEKEKGVKKLVVPKWKVSLKKNVILYKKSISPKIPRFAKNLLKS